MQTNRMTIIGAGLIAVLAAAGLTAVAQEAGPESPRAGRERGPGPRGPGGPMGMLGDIGIPLPALNLSDEQKTQVKAVMDAHRDQGQQIAQRLGPAHQAVRQAIETSPVDELLIRAKSAELAAAEADAAVFRARLRSEVFALLTPEQQQLAGQMRMRRPGPGPRGGGPMRRQQQ